MSQTANATAEIETMTAPRQFTGATYSVDDNKIRMYPRRRLDAETYARVKAAGFAWAPKQELFVAPKWTPAREDLAIELCGEIGDEDTTLVERAEERADRFENYSEKRETEAHRAREHVASIADGIPFGQPILVAHHSERRARKDAERIENGMRKAVKLWETSKYWTNRAAGAIAHAKYKEKPTVRARRIKTLEAEKRGEERTLARCEKLLALWDREPMTMDLALTIANLPEAAYSSYCFTLEKFPRNPPLSQYEGSQSLWSALSDCIITAEQARDLARPSLRATIRWAKRWIEHFDMRLIYERCMLEESGYEAPKKEKSAKQTLPLCNYKAETISYPNMYYADKTITVAQIEMTKEQYARIYKDYKYTKIVDGSHKVRIAQVKGDTVAVFLTDSKVHEKPAATAPVEPRPPVPRPVRAYVAPARTEFDDIKDSLKAGVQVVSAPQLFPTPRALAARMVDLLNVELGHRVLEPSAGTGVLLDAIKQLHPHMNPHAIEVNLKLANELRLRGYHCDAFDFLELAPSLEKFDRIIANPPFGDAQDISHIITAFGLLKAGGRMVAICANGPRQNAALKPLASSWERLPEGTFLSQGTNVNVILAVFDVVS